jgi:hypothetical protein
MPRCRITCVWPDGSHFRATEAEAEQLVCDGLAEWDGTRTLRMQEISNSGGKLSLQAGGKLATAAQRNESWARVAVQAILGR